MPDKKEKLVKLEIEVPIVAYGNKHAIEKFTDFITKVIEKDGTIFNIPGIKIGVCDKPKSRSYGEAIKDYDIVSYTCNYIKNAFNNS